jgi:hypothetical protein
VDENIIAFLEIAAKHKDLERYQAPISALQSGI